MKNFWRSKRKSRGGKPFVTGFPHRKASGPLSFVSDRPRNRCSLKVHHPTGRWPDGSYVGLSSCPAFLARDLMVLCGRGTFGKGPSADKLMNKHFVELNPNLLLPCRIERPVKIISPDLFQFTNSHAHEETICNTCFFECTKLSPSTSPDQKRAP